MAGQQRKDYYQVLGVERDADPEELKKAYRRLAKEHHPDRHPDDVQAEERFKEVQEAYDVLKDPGKRDRYDGVPYHGAGGTGAHGARRDRGTGGGRKGGVSEFVDDVFTYIKNKMEDRGRRGEDLRYLMTVSLEEVAQGVRKVVRIPKCKECPTCDGKGWTTPGKSPVCEVCRGEGEITIKTRSGGGPRVCPGCEGKGILEKISCKRCKGKGTIPYRVQRTVSIPAGVDNGTRLKIRGEGGEGEGGGENGDLYIVIQVKDHPLFTRHNLDVWCELPISFTQAALGAEILAPTLRGGVPLRIPAGTQPGDQFTLEGYGIPGLHGASTGDQKIKVHVEVPRNISRKEREILKAWEACRKT